MRLLGIDYGRKKVGLAISAGRLAEPMKVIRYSDNKVLSEEIGKIIERENIEKIVIGVSEDQMAEETRMFSESMKQWNNVTVDLYDETLTSQDAQKLSIEAGISRKKRREMEDAYAATLMLQNFIDTSL